MVTSIPWGDVHQTVSQKKGSPAESVVGSAAFGMDVNRIAEPGLDARLARQEYPDLLQSE